MVTEVELYQKQKNRLQNMKKN